MIRTNLATRPFYNERVVRACLAAVGALVALATLYNGVRILQYSRSDSTLGTQATSDERRAAELRGAAARLRGSVSAKDAEASSTRVRAANALIDRRVFSWTDLLARLESTLPGNARIASITPKTEGVRTIVSLSVLARSVEDVDRFMESLEATGVFADVLARAERVAESGQIEVALEATYEPTRTEGGDAVQAAAAAPAVPAAAPGGRGRP